MAAKTVDALVWIIIIKVTITMIFDATEKKETYVRPECESLRNIQSLSLLASLSLEGDFEETLIDGGNATYENLDPSQFN